MASQVQLKVAEINQLNPLLIAEDSRVESKFIQMYNAIWGTDMGAQIYEKEKFNFRKILHCNNAQSFHCMVVSWT